LHNYSTWKLRFQLLCAELGYSRALLQAPIAEADVIISDKVKSVMAKNVKNHHLQTIVRAANAKAAWDALAATFASTCNTRKVALRQELSDFKMANEDGRARQAVWQGKTGGDVRVAAWCDLAAKCKSVATTRKMALQRRSTIRLWFLLRTP
ncbi:hypothetical protein VaNZ11_009131, partial [Volvox africanus]